MGDDDAKYGPSGYLPQRASQRARKIVLREPLGKGWIVASVVGAAIMLVVAGIYLVTQMGAPGGPYRDAGPIEDFDPRGAASTEVDGFEVLVVRGAGGVQVFEAPGSRTVWCRESQRIEAADGRVWNLSGQLRGGQGSSLRPLRAEVRDGRLYIDPTPDLPMPVERPSGEEPQCV